jgi:hypothetical protein
MPLLGGGVLGPGQTEAFDVVLQGGVSYTIFVDPYQVGVDFDLGIFDENGNLVAQDTSTAPNAVCVVTPRWTGPFRLVVKSARGLSNYQIRVLP